LLPLANFTNKTIHLEKIRYCCLRSSNYYLKFDGSHCQRYDGAYYGEKQVAFQY